MFLDRVIPIDSIPKWIACERSGIARTLVKSGQVDMKRAWVATPAWDIHGFWEPDFDFLEMRSTAGKKWSVELASSPCSEKRFAEG